MARADKVATCPTCGGTFQMRGAGSHFLACAQRAGKPAPAAPVARKETHAEEVARVIREGGHEAVVLHDSERPKAAPQEPAPPRPAGRPRFETWKGGARG